MQLSSANARLAASSRARRWRTDTSASPNFTCAFFFASAVPFFISEVVEAESEVSTTTTVFVEGGGPLNTTVVTPSVAASVDLAEPVTVSASWEADVVSGASVAVVDTPAPAVDVISSATQYSDFRQVVSGGLTLRSSNASITAGYSYGWENDYRSHSIQLSAQADLFERNTNLELSYGRGFDSVCNLRSVGPQDPVERGRLPNADGCFDDGSSNRVSESLSLQTVQGAWTQAWTPIFTTQLTLTAQILNGFQANPYRGVWLGRTSAQEFHPENRARFAAGLGARLWFEPTEGAFRAFVRVYRDTWGIESLTGELGYSQSLGEDLRVGVRGRYYNQTAAGFYSDDYGSFLRGQYFTGDRELSPFSSFTAGGRITYIVPPDDSGDVLGFLSDLQIAGKVDFVIADFRDFRYGQVKVPNNSALAATLHLNATF